MKWSKKLKFEMDELSCLQLDGAAVALLLRLHS